MTVRAKRLSLVFLVPLAVLGGVALSVRGTFAECCTPSAFERRRFEGALQAAHSARPTDFALVVEHGTGSLAPEFHYDYEVRIAPGGAAELRYWPGYGHVDSLMVRGTFTVGAATLDSLWRLAAPLRRAPGSRPARDVPDGGASPKLTLTGGGRRTVIDPWQPDPWSERAHALVGAVRRAIPDAVWATGEAAQARVAKRRQTQLSERRD